MVGRHRQKYWTNTENLFNNVVLRGLVESTQFNIKDWRDFLTADRLETSMSRRGNCHDNAVAESFFQLLKRERIKRKTHATRNDARQDIFDYIEMFYNLKRRHGFNDRFSPAEFERRYFERIEGVKQTHGDSVDAG